MADEIHDPASNAISGPGMWLHTSENIALMTIIPTVLPLRVDKIIKVELPGGHVIKLKVATK